jgi:hypothetical protein
MFSRQALTIYFYLSITDDILFLFIHSSMALQVFCWALTDFFPYVIL